MSCEHDPIILCSAACQPRINRDSPWKGKFFFRRSNWIANCIPRLGRAQQRFAVDLAFGLESSMVCTSTTNQVEWPSPAHPAKPLKRQPLGAEKINAKRDIFDIMNYIRLWLDFYINPNRFARKIADIQSPKWGFYASLQRSLMDSLLLYFPLFVMGKVPPEPSYISFIQTKQYYGALIGLTPPVLMIEWIIGATILYLFVRLLCNINQIDLIINITGFSTLAIGSVLLVWDWFWLIVGGMNQYSLGISHLAIDIWGIAITTYCYYKIIKVPIWISVLSSIVGMAAAMPLAIMFMRSPI